MGQSVVASDYHQRSIFTNTFSKIFKKSIGHLNIIRRISTIFSKFPTICVFLSNLRKNKVCLLKFFWETFQNSTFLAIFLRNLCKFEKILRHPEEGTPSLPRPVYEVDLRGCSLRAEGLAKPLVYYCILIMIPLAKLTVVPSYIRN